MAKWHECRGYEAASHEWDGERGFRGLPGQGQPGFPWAWLWVTEGYPTWAQDHLALHAEAFCRSRRQGPGARGCVANLLPTDWPGPCLAGRWSAFVSDVVRRLGKASY